MQITDVILYPSIQYLSNCSLEFALSDSFLKIMTDSSLLTVDMWLKMIKKIISKVNAMGKSSSHISLYNLFQCRRLAVAHCYTRNWKWNMNREVNVGTSKKKLFNYLINFLTKLK